MRSAVGAVAGLATLTILVRKGGRLALIDRAISDAVTQHRAPAAAPVARAVTQLGETRIAYPVLMIVLVLRAKGLTLNRGPAADGLYSRSKVEDVHVYCWGCAREPALFSTGLPE